MERQTFVFKQVGDCAVHADVYRPPGDKVLPVVVWIHGGCLICGGRTVPRRYVQMYTNAGYVLVSIDYRLAPETKVAAIIEDLQDAFRWVREEGPSLFAADPERLAVVGHSAGGYLALMSGCCVEPRPRALVSFYGYGDIIGPWYSRPDPFYCQSPPIPREEAYAAVGQKVIANGRDGSPERFRFYLYCRQHGLWPLEVGGHDPHQEPEAFTRYCPIQQIGPDYPPTLMLHGTADTDVPYHLSATMADALAAAGIAHELVTIEGGGHGFDAKADEDVIVADALARVPDFLRQHLT